MDDAVPGGGGRGASAAPAAAASSPAAAVAAAVRPRGADAGAVFPSLPPQPQRRRRLPNVVRSLPAVNRSMRHDRMAEPLSVDPYIRPCMRGDGRGDRCISVSASTPSIG